MEMLNTFKEMPLKKKAIIAVILIVVVFILSGIIVPHRPSSERFRTMKVERGEVVSTVSATGTLAAVVTVQVGTQVSGTIEKLFVDFNSPVKAGQVIAKIDSSLFSAKVKETLGDYNTAVANLEKAKEDLIDAQRTVERTRKLFKNNYISRAEYDSSETKYQQSVAAVKAAESNVTRTQGLYDQAKINLQYATITSPVDGIVISRNVDVGQTVAASFQTPTLFTIAQDLTKMEIQTSVDEADISKVRLKQPVNFTVDSYSTQTFSGTVSQIRKAPILTQNVVTYIVIVSVDNRDLKLMPGMTAEVTIEAIRKTGVLKVPGAALRFKPETAQTAGTDTTKTDSAEAVYVLRDGKPVRVPVQTGVVGDNAVEILPGGELKENDDVIVEEVSKEDAKGGAGSGPRSMAF